MTISKLAFLLATSMLLAACSDGLVTIENGEPENGEPENGEAENGEADPCEAVPNTGCPCDDDETCTAGDNPCLVAECVEGYCGLSNAPDGEAACGDGGTFCFEGECVDGCLIEGEHHEPGASADGVDCMVCRPQEDPFAWTDECEPEEECSEDGECPSDEVCWEGFCERGCVISGELFAAGEANPQDACMVCDPSADTSGWSDSCPHGTGCRDGQCVTGCIISGSFYFPDEENSANSCQVCDPARDDTGWSDQCLRADMYDDLPYTVHVGYDGRFSDGSQSWHRPNRTNGWHSSITQFAGALDYTNNSAQPGATIRFSAHAIDNVTTDYYPGEAFDIEVFGRIRTYRTTELFYSDGSESHTEEKYYVDCYYINPISGAEVKVASVLYEHLIEQGLHSVDDEVHPGDELGNIAHVTSSRYTNTGRLWTTGTHLHFEVTRAGEVDWRGQTYGRAGYTGRFIEGFRSPWDITSHPDYEHRFPWGDSTGYWWYDPAFFFNDYHLYDETDYS